MVIEVVKIAIAGFVAYMVQGTDGAIFSMVQDIESDIF